MNQAAFSILKVRWRAAFRRGTWLQNLRIAISNLMKAGAGQGRLEPFCDDIRLAV
jgi:hypothetical protein